MIELGLSRVKPAPVEERAVGYTDLLLDAIMRRAAAGEAITNVALGAVQVAAGLVARALTVAIPSGDMGLLRPSVLYDIGFDLVRRGQSLWLLRVDPDGRAQLLRADTADPVVHGGADPRSWKYVLTLGAPSQQQSVEVGAESVAHFRINCEALTPYRGRAPLQLAAATGQLARALSGSLGDESSVTVARILALPQGTGEATLNMLKNAVTNPSQGRVLLPETTKGGFGEGQGTAPQRDWRSERLGFEAPTAAVELYNILLQEVGAICGIPWALMPGSGAAGPGLREANRTFLSTTVEPLGLLVAAELGRVLETPVTIRHDKLAAADVVSRARALKGLVDAGIPLEEAKGLVGW